MKEQTTNSGKFLAIYNELDRFMRESLDEDFGTPHYRLIEAMAKKNRVFKQHSYDLKAFADLRNAIVHNPDARVADPIAEPHDYVIQKYKEIMEEVMNPPRALETIAVGIRDIYTTTMEANALEVMEEMNRNCYTHVPVLHDGRLLGIFSENTIFSYLVQNQAATTLRDHTIGDFIELIPIDKHTSEYFEFAPKTSLVIDIEARFQSDLSHNKRLQIVFITENGKSTEKLLGLITPWDLAGYCD